MTYSYVTRVTYEVRQSIVRAYERTSGHKSQSHKSHNSQTIKLKRSQGLGCEERERERERSAKRIERKSQ